MKNNGKGAVATPFSSFEFSGIYVRRHQSIGSVMPVNSGFCYAVVLTDAYFRHSSLDIPISGFAQLCAALHEDSVMNALVSARESGSLTEGKKYLPSAIVDFLMSIGEPTIYIRFDDDGKLWCRNIEAALLKTDIIASQPVRNGEFEICDSNDFWYLRFRDDEPVMFFAAKADLIDELTRKFPDNIWIVPSGFIYSG